MKVNYHESKLIEGKIQNKLIELNIKVSFPEFCEAELKHANLLAEIYDGKIYSVQTDNDLYVNYLDVPKMQLIDQLFAL